jgi:hypothetical protein
MITLQNVCIVCSLPIKIHRTDVRGLKRLHSEDGSAIEFADGYFQNYLYGVYFDQKLFKKVTSKKATLRSILSIKNMEQRMAVMKLHGSEKIVESPHAFLIETSKRGNSLYVIPKEEKIFDENEYFLKYKCPSTDRIYVKPVSPEIGSKHDADFAQASTFKVACIKDGKLKFRSWTKEEYDSLVLES